MTRIFAAVLALALLAASAPAQALGVLVTGTKVTAPAAGAAVVDSGLLDLAKVGIGGSCADGGATKGNWTITVWVAAQVAGVYRLVFLDATTPTPLVTKTMLFYVPALQTVPLVIPSSISIVLNGKIQVQPDANVAAGNIVVANLNLSFDGCE